MSTFALSTAGLFDAPKLRLHPAKADAPSAPNAGDARTANAGGARTEVAERPTLRLVGEPRPETHPVLVAGADSAGRAAVLHDLTETMPPSTTFAEAEAFWEVLMRAPSSSMVILSGELDELPPESLMQMLAQRHPGLPVVGLDSSAAGVETEARN